MSPKPRIARPHARDQSAASDPEAPGPIARTLEQPLGTADADPYFEAAELFLQRGDARSAVLAAQRGMRLAPPRPAQQALYAWMLYKRDGRVTPVKPHVFRHLEQALASDPACVYAHCFMGVLLTRTGDFERARWHLSRVLELDPHHQQAARARELLAALGA
jgi:cytochrome c-type biogenesis protein CcmH/NrfG